METLLHDTPARALVRARGATQGVDLSPAHQAALVRFPRRRRKAVRRLALVHPYYADLMVSFPAAIFVLAHGRPGRTAEARRLVVAGAPLKRVADALALPMWTRRVPVEACGPGLLLALPHSAYFAAHVVNVMPREVSEWGKWLEAVSVAAAAMDERFALWVAREIRRYKPLRDTAGIAALGVWAWYGAGERNAASALMPERWHGDMSLASAAAVAIEWYRGLDFLLTKAPAPLDILPPADNAVGPYTFEPLGWGAPLVEEGLRLKNCLATYTWEYVRGSRVWSIRRSGVRVGALELGFDRTRRGVPRLEQLLAATNADAPDEVWAAAYQWLARWQVTAEERRIDLGDVESERVPGAWHRLWLPYWRAKGLAPDRPMPVVTGFEPDIGNELGGVRGLIHLDRRRPARAST